MSKSPNDEAVKALKRFRKSNVKEHARHWATAIKEEQRIIAEDNNLLRTRNIKLIEAAKAAIKYLAPLPHHAAASAKIVLRAAIEENDDGK